MARHQPQHPLFQIGPVIPRIAVGDGNRDRFLLVRVAIVARIFSWKIGSADRKRSGIDMQMVCFDAEALASLQSQSRKQGRRIMLIDPIQRSAQAIDTTSFSVSGAYLP